MGSTPGPHVLFTVSDTGSGMTPEILDRIFDPFFTTKEPGKGTGLGLATVHTVVMSHGGFLDVESKPNMGARFRVYIPARAHEDDRQAKDEQDTLSRGNGETILVVDDEEAVREVTRQTLETYGYRVLTGADGVDGVSAYTQRRGEIDLVLTDIMMPVMDGTSFIRALRKINPAARVIVMSGMLSDSSKESITAFGIQARLQKPFTAAELLTTVRSALVSRSNPLAV